MTLQIDHPIAGVYVECDGTDAMRERGRRLRGRVIDADGGTFVVAFDACWPAVRYANSGWSLFQVLTPDIYFLRCAKDVLRDEAEVMGMIR